MRKPLARLHDIIEAVENLAKYSVRSQEEFKSDELLQSHFILQLQIIGEAANALPEEIRAMAPEVPWRDVVGMRHILAHGYFLIDTNVVWETAVHQVPKLDAPLKTLMRSLER